MKNKLFDDLRTDYEKNHWVVRQSYDHQGVFCDYCKCGVAHPNPEWIMENKHNRFLAYSFHPCCGCCTKKQAKEVHRSRNKSVGSGKNSREQETVSKRKKTDGRDTSAKRTTSRKSNKDR